MPKTFTDDRADTPPEVRFATGEVSGAGTVTLVTPSSGMKLVVTALDAFCGHANVNDTSVEFLFGSGTTIRKHPGVAPGSGFVVGSGAGAVAEGGADEALKVTVSDPGGVTTFAAAFYELPA